MDVRDVVRKAWQVTQVHLKKLIWYGSVPAFFTIVVSSAYLGYQYNAFNHSAALGGVQEMNLMSNIRMVWGIVSHYPALTVLAILLAITIFGGYTLSPPIFRATLIQALMRIKNYESITGSFEIGVRRFCPMFEFALITGSFSIITVFTESSFILRWWGEKMFFLALPILLFIGMVGVIASFLFTYTEYFIVLEDKKIIESIKESVILVISNLRKTILIFILMLLIGVRIILNILLVLFIPMGIVALSGYLATTFLHTIGLVILGILGFIVLLVASYLMGLFNVFATAVWVFTYSALTERSQHHTKEKKEKEAEE